jgi:(2Fe-2S) ferredoxin
MGILNQFNFGVMERNLIGQVIVTPTDCLGPCQFGPTVVVYPEGIWYKNVTDADVAVILDEHVGKGKPVERLRMPDEVWG